MDDSWWIVGDTNGVVVVGFMGSVRVNIVIVVVVVVFG